MDAVKESTVTIDRLIAMGALTGKPFATLNEDEQAVLVPHGFEVKTLAKRLDNPRRKDVRVTLYKVESFVAYVNEHKSDYTRVFAVETEDGATYTAIIDYHETGPDGTPSFCTHFCVLELAYTEEFKQLKAANLKKFGQTDFAEFIEDHAHEIARPAAAEMKEIALTLEAAKGVEFNSSVRLGDGAVKLMYEETIQAKAGQKGDLEIPEEIVFCVKPFKGGEAAEMKALLRFRIGSGQVAFFYRILELSKTVADSIDATTDVICASTKLPVYFGKVR